MAKALRVDHGPIDDDVVNSLTDAEKEWLRSWNRQDEIPGEDGNTFIDTLDPNNTRGDAGDEGSGDASEYDDLGVDDLKERLRARDLPVSGNKAALIERLVEDDNADDSDDDSDDDADDEDDDDE